MDLAVTVCHAAGTNWTHFTEAVGGILITLTIVVCVFGLPITRRGRRSTD